MTETNPPDWSGPIEDLHWPETLESHALTPEPSPRLHGYDTEGDLALHYSFAEIALVALREAAPEAHAGATMEVCVSFLAAAPIWEAPANAAAITRVAGAKPAGGFAQCLPTEKVTYVGRGPRPSPRSRLTGGTSKWI